MLRFIDGNFNSIYAERGQVIVIAIIIIAITLAIYVLRAIGLFVMAKRAKVNHAVLAWIPCLWVYLACKLIGKTKILNKPFSKLAVIFCVIFAVSEFLTLVYQFLIYFPVIGNYLMGRNIYYLVVSDSDAQLGALTKGLTQYWGDGLIYYDSEFINPYGESLYTIKTILNTISWVQLPFDLMSIFIVVTVYINLFRKYWPAHFVLGSILSIFIAGAFGIIVFAIKNREPMEYIDFVRQRYQQYGYGPYGNPYNNPYATKNAQAQRPPEHPFSEFAEKNEVDPGNPFEEFSENNKNDSKDE